jgi:hypothetical protein
LGRRDVGYENCMHGNWQWLKLMPNEVLLLPAHIFVPLFSHSSHFL